MGHLTAQPAGELLAHWLTQDLSPPENYGNQMLFITYRTDREKRTQGRPIWLFASYPSGPPLPATPARRQNGHLADDV